MPHFSYFLICPSFVLKILITLFTTQNKDFCCIISLLLSPFSSHSLKPICQYIHTYIYTHLHLFTDCWNPSSEINNMCPMRFILVFFSALLAGYMAWRTVRSTPVSDKDVNKGGKVPANDTQQSSIIKMMQNGFWVFVDMASGRYLWKNLREMKKDDDKVVTS